MMRTNNAILGISCVMTGMAFGSLMDASIKALSSDYPLHEIILVRSVVALVLTLFIVRFEGGFRTLRTSRPFTHLARGLLIVIANMSFYMAISVMPLAEATGLFFVSPLFITALSVPFLGERVGWRRWLGILVGFIGVIIIMRPGVDTFTAYSILPIIAALAYAITQITSRNLGITDSASVMSFYISLTFIVISAIFWAIAGDGSMAGMYGDKMDFLFRPWRWPDFSDGSLMLFVGVLVAIVGYMLSQAYRVADASVVAPFEFVMLVLAIFWGYLFWGEIPDIQASLGIAMIAGSGLYVFMREKHAARLGTEIHKTN